MASITYKCPNCGGPLKWKADKQRYGCEYCLSEFTETELAALSPDRAHAEAVKEREASESTDGAAAASSPKDSGEASAASEQSGVEDSAPSEQGAAGEKQEAVLRYTCPSCGAELVTGETTAATFCYYCHNPVVLSDRLDGNYHPDYIIPFEIDREKALSIFRAWIRQHKYIPKDFYNEKQIELLSGVYFPYWLYTCKVKGHVAGEGRQLRTWMLGDLRYTETSIYGIEKNGEMNVENVTRIALKKANRMLCESVMPFRMEAMKPFSMGYLQGFVAESRDIEKESMEEEVSTEVKEYAERALKQSASEGFAAASFDRVESEVTDGAWHYVLLPVWTLTYRQKESGTLYYFSVNGQSGKTCGELPVDRKRLFGLFLRCFAAVFALLLCVLFFL